MEIHKSCEHGGRDKMLYALKNKCYVPKPIVELFVFICDVCEKKHLNPRKNIVTQPIVSKDFNVRRQVNLIDLQSAPDGDFKWLMTYQDNTTKFLHLRLLHSKRARSCVGTTKNILKFGAPYILQSDNGREFSAGIVKELMNMWSKCKIIHGRPRHPQTHSNQDMENMLRNWMEDNKSMNWSIGCYFVPWQKNSSFHRIIGRSYHAFFGCVQLRN